MARAGKNDPVKIIEERGERFAVVPEQQYRNLIALVEELEDALEMKRAIQAGGDFISLEELDAELGNADLL